jgi:hypothetical protein
MYKEKEQSLVGLESDNVSEWSDMSTHGRIQWVSTNIFQLVIIIIISLNVTWSRRHISEKLLIIWC